MNNRESRFNSRRLLVLMVVILVIVLSFFAGRYYGSGRKNSVSPPLPSETGPASDRAGVPPDSLASGR